jgi:hypothetical protein
MSRHSGQRNLAISARGLPASKAYYLGHRQSEYAFRRLVVQSLPPAVARSLLDKLDSFTPPSVAVGSIDPNGNSAY